MSKPLQVLIIEDSIDDAELMLIALRHGGFAVSHQRVENATELRDALAVQGWEVVLSDYTLPSLRAPEALAQVRSADETLPFIVISGTVGEVVAAEMMRAGASDYLTKESLPRLAPAVARALRERENRKERQQAEARGRHLAALVDSSADSICTLTLDRHISTWNRGAVRLYGWTPEDAIGQHISLVVPAERIAELEAALAQIEHGDSLALFESVRIRRDGERMPVSVSLSPIRAVDGRLTGFASIVRDISESRRAAERLSQDALILANVRDSVVVIDREGVVTHWNDGAARLFGWQTHEMLGHHYSERFRDELWPRLDAARMPRAHAATVGGEFETYRKDGSRAWIESRIQPLEDAEGKPMGILWLAYEISGRKQAETALRQSERRFRRFVEADIVGIIYWNAAGEITDANEAFLAMIGRTRAELNAGELRWSDLTPLQYRERDQQLLGVLLANGAIPNYEKAFRHRDGSLVPVIIGAAMLEDGGTEGVAFILDLTEQKRAQKAQQEALTMLQAVIEGTTDLVYVKDFEGRYRMINSSGAYFLGATAAEVLGRQDSDFMSPESAQVLSEMDRRIMATNVPMTCENRVLVGGVPRTFLATTGPYRDEAGQAQGVIGISRDITERKAAEDSLRESEARFRAMADSFPHGLALVNPHGKILYLNSSAFDILGRDLEAFQERGWLQMLHRVERRHVVREWRTGLASRKKFECQHRLLHADGKEISIHARIAPIWIGNDLFGFVCMLEDVTRLRELEEQLRQSQKLEAIGLLAGGVAHDFNNMLSVINGYSELILAGDCPAVVAKCVQEISQAGGRAANLTRQLLAFSRKQALAPVALNLNDLVLDLHSMLRRLLGTAIELTTIPCSCSTRIEADPGQIEQILINLVVNAGDAMPQGGRIVIELSHTSEEPAAQVPTVLGGRACAILRVRDSGTGMDAATRGRIFEPFFTTKALGRGTGLGLATVYGIVRQSGGAIEVESEVGRGAAFTVYFPEATGGVTLRETVAPPGVGHGSETVLVVDDEPNVRGFVCMALANCGYTVLDASQGDEALRLANMHEGPIHLLIADLMMPLMTGPELATRFAGLYPEAAILFMSGYPSDPALQQGLLGSRGAFLQKPFSLSALADRVRAVLDESTLNAFSPRSGKEECAGRVLIVDDDPALRESLEALLEEEGYLVATFGDGLGALEHLRSGDPLPDVIFLDLRMPTMNGWVFRLEQEKDPVLAAIPVVVLSGSTETESAAEFLSAAGAIKKPLEVEDFLNVVRHFCSKRVEDGPVDPFSGQSNR